MSEYEVLILIFTVIGLALAAYVAGSNSRKNNRH